MPPQFFYFDMGNVLVNFDRERAYRNLAALTGAPIERVRETLGQSGLPESLEHGRIDWPTFHAEFSRLTGTASDPASLANAYSDMFELSVGMLPVIVGLGRAGCRTGILSNTCDVHWRHILSRRYGILPGTFSPIVLSHEIGTMKPAPGIFEHAASKAGVEPARIFFCDDMPENVAAAKRAGWDAELFTGPSALTRSLEARGIDLGAECSESPRQDTRTG